MITSNTRYHVWENFGVGKNLPGNSLANILPPIGSDCIMNNNLFMVVYIDG